MQTDNNSIESAPDTLREIDEDAIEEQLARIAASFDMPYEELLTAFRGGR
jgi:hypothetical protein